MDEPGFGLSVVLRYGVFPALVLGLLTAWCATTRRPWGFRPSRPDRIVWGLIAGFCAIYGLMGSLRYLAYRTTIQDLGVHIGMDEFGTGHTPLPRLQQLPTDFLKIDGELVANLTSDGEIHTPGCDMVAALVQVGTTLGLSVIAAGIQSEIETAILVECGCQYGQGELRPRPSTAPMPNLDTHMTRRS